jgi:hypothetical protein
VIAEEHDIFGDGVNVAARLEALAEPGRIWVSRVVRDQVRDKLDYGFEDLGEQSVKNIARPVRVYRVSDLAVPIEQPLPPRPSHCRCPTSRRWRCYLKLPRFRGVLASLVDYASIGCTSIACS